MAAIKGLVASASSSWRPLVSLVAFAAMGSRHYCYNNVLAAKGFRLMLLVSRLRALRGHRLDSGFIAVANRPAMLMLAATWLWLLGSIKMMAIKVKKAVEQSGKKKKKSPDAKALMGNCWVEGICNDSANSVRRGLVYGCLAILTRPTNI